jgi:predicted metallo-beta-lactamase superfamily hydrolase|tara:strand:+ start:66 stop:572 length:507 start_codon:yes stop_codon:yes gene_type:complete
VIKIINDFFEKDKYDQIMYHIKNHLYFTPRYFKEDVEKSRETYYGDRFLLDSDKNLLNAFIEQAENKFKIKIIKMDTDSGIDLRNLDKFIPHVDYSNINILIMLDGPVGVTTGTVFYTDGDLDIHVGFRPNRAILFPSNYFHSPHKCEMKGMRRYTASLFISDYEDSI